MKVMGRSCDDFVMIVEVPINSFNYNELGNVNSANAGTFHGKNRGFREIHREQGLPAAPVTGLDRWPE